MHITFDTIKTTAFTVKYKLRGYKLLQNPKGTNPLEVTMIKSWFSFDSDYFDKFYANTRIRRTKAGDKFVTDRIDILTEYLMDPELLTYSAKNKNIFVTHQTADGNLKSRSREVMSVAEKKKRPLPDFIDKQDARWWGEELFKENREKSGYYLPRPSLLARIVSLGMWEKILGYNEMSRPVEPGFWQVLKTNLKGGGSVLK